jgi:drug/metabolite transporter (DMT)-like permease
MGDGGGRRAPEWRLWLGLATVYLVWGSTYLAIRVMVREVPPLLGAGARFLLAGSILYAVLRLRRGGPARVRVGRRELAACALLGVLLPAGGNGVVTVAERDVPSSLAALILASIPLWVALWRRATGDQVARSTAVGVAVGFTGVALLLLPGNRPDGATALGLVLCVLAATSWATGSFLAGRLRLPGDPLVATAYEMLFGGAALLVAGAAGGELADLDPARLDLGSAWSFAYLVTFGSLVAYSAYTWLLTHAPVSKVATYAFVNPVVAVILGWAILSEEITALMLVGAGVIVTSVALVVRTESRREPRPVAALAHRPAPAREPAR